MDRDEQRELAREIAEAQRRDKEKRLGRGCVVVIGLFIAAWIGLTALINGAGP